MGSSTSTEDIRNQSEQLRAVLQMMISNDDLSKLIEQTVQGLKSLTNVKLDIAITGESGTGKSSLVNALRRMKDYEEGAAKTDVNEGTIDPQGYTLSKKFPNVTVWDLPGIGSPELPATEYVQKINLKKYDFFIIVAPFRLTENDILLAREIHKMNKKFYCVCTKIDVDLGNEKQKAIGREETFSEEITLTKKKKYVCDNLRRANEFHPRVFLVCNHDWDEYDFPHLLKVLESELDEFKRCKLLKASSNESKRILEKKKAGTEALITKIASVSSATGDVQVPCLSSVCNICFLEATMKDFSTVFGLDDHFLHQLAKLGKPVSVLSSAIKETKIASQIDSEFVKSLLRKIREHKIKTEWGSWMRSWFRVVKTVEVVSCMLQRFLDDAEKDAVNILAEAFKN